ncbi:MAG TPA: YgjP-like metallopeptidase domain-containing protein [Rhodocyclaceae bacterium]
MKPRHPQLALRLDFDAPDPGARWRDGARLPYLGGEIVLSLDTDRRTAALEDGVLHLPLPPEATARQVQDGAEAWLRKEAARLLAVCVAIEARRLGRSPPHCSLSFASRASWVQPDGRGGLRCNWRLIEQPIETIEQTVALAVAKLPAAEATPDLFACAA